MLITMLCAAISGILFNLYNNPVMYIIVFISQAKKPTLCGTRRKNQGFNTPTPMSGS